MIALAILGTSPSLSLSNTVNLPLSNLEWVDCRVKCGRKPGVANT